jgi:RNA polymerase sigma-70 factor (ECF subfamily)
VIPASPEVAAALARVARKEGGRVVALLAGHFRDLDLADDAVQDALLEAVQTWPERGVPDNPAGWLLTVARRKAIDRIRRTDSARRRTLAAAPELSLPEPEPDEEASGMVLDQSDVRDDQLRLILLCCHPALHVDAQVALTLRLVGGLTTPEIAAAFLVPEATMAQRLVRAKRKIRDAKIPLTIPAAFADRLATLLRVLYLVFNEGYLSSGTGNQLVRVDLTDEAVRLTGLVVDLVPDSAEAKGLLALELFHRARMPSRVGPDGDLVLLEDQDRSSWDRDLVATANHVLRDATERRDLGTFQLQAMIAGYHANAATAADTDWRAIADVYAELSRRSSSPVVRLNQAVAVAMADGARAGLDLLDAITDLDGYHLLHAARGELLLRAGSPEQATAAFRTARTLARNPVEQRHLDRRLDIARDRLRRPGSAPG